MEGEQLQAISGALCLDNNPTEFCSDAILARHNECVILKKHKFVGSDERVRCGWHQVQVWSADGSFVIGAKDDKKTYAALSCIHVPNVHILEHLIRLGFKKGINKLSDSLEDE
jgi:hypothetical protein